MRVGSRRARFGALCRLTGPSRERGAGDSAVVAANDSLRSVADDLLENAVEHNDTRDPLIEVTVEATTDTVSLTVRDDGPGIPDDEVAALFD